jgi:hypothetical protein
LSFDIPFLLSLIISVYLKGEQQTLPFIWMFRAHCRIFSWHNFNIDMFQGIGRPKEQERDGEWLDGGASDMSMAFDAPKFLQ